MVARINRGGDGETQALAPHIEKGAGKDRTTLRVGFRDYLSPVRALIKNLMKVGRFERRIRRNEDEILRRNEIQPSRLLVEFQRNRERFDHAFGGMHLAPNLSVDRLGEVAG